MQDGRFVVQRAAAGARHPGMGIGALGSVDQLLFARHSHGAVTPAHVAQLEHLVATGDRAASGLLPTAGNRFRLVDSASDFADGVVADFAAADHHINFTVYAAHPGAPDGPIADRIVRAAEARAAEGLPVTAHLDALGSGLAFPSRERRQFVERMRDSGIDVVVKPFNLRRGPNDDAWRAVDHRKIFEVDGRVAWGGGVNVVDAWSPWHDLMQRVEGPAAAQAGAVMAARFRDLGGEVTPERVAVLRRGLMSPVDDASHATRLLTDGNRHRRELSDAFVDVARSAQERFWLMDPYLSDPRAMREVVGAARRLGPGAELFVSPKVATGGQPQDVFTDPLRRAWAYRFAEAGGQVHLVDRFSHAKGWIADDVAGVGSHNKDRSSIRLSYENLMATNDPVAVGQLESAMQRQRSLGTQAGEDGVAGWRNLARVRDALHLQY